MAGRRPRAATFGDYGGGGGRGRGGYGGGGRGRGRGDDRQELVAAGEGSGEEEELVRPYWAKRRDVQHQATRQQLRAVAPDGLLVEDILRRIEFDEALPEAEFRAFIDPVDHTDPERPPTPRGAKWCRSHCWTGRCSYAGQCWYSHGGPRLVPWGRGAAAREPGRAPGSNKAPLPQMVEVGLGDVNLQEAFSIIFLLFEGQVVWGRDLGAAGAELWGRFVVSRRRPSGAAHDDPFAADSGRPACLVDLPQVLLARVVRSLGVEDLVACALAVGHAADWAAVVEERWPLSSPATAAIDGGGGAPDAAAAAGDAERSAEQRPICQLASLAEASRLAAQLLQWPPREPGASPHTSPFASSPFSAAAAGGASPDAEAAWLPRGSGGTASPAVLEWTAAAVDPACIRFESEVHSLCLHASLAVAQSSNGDLRAIRRSDLKQITSMKIKDASCFDICSEVLVVGTFAPARLLAYDLSTSTPKVRHQLRLDQACSVIAVAARDTETCLCCLAREDTPGAVEVLILDCSEDLRVASRHHAAGFAPLGAGCLTAAGDGLLSLWDVTGHTFRLERELPCSPLLAGGAASPPSSAAAPLSSAAAMGPVLVAGGSGRFAAAAAPRHPDAPLWAHDLRAAAACGGEPPSAAPPLPPPPPPRLVAWLASAAMGLRAASPPAPAFRWSVELLHVEGALLVVLVRAAGDGDGEGWSLSADPPAAGATAAAALAPTGPRLFAWHLPSCRPLLAGHATLPITTFARSEGGGGGGGGGGRIAFAGGRPAGRDGRGAAYFVVVPGAGRVRRPSRRGGFTGPMRRSVNASDARARGLHKQGSRRGPQR